MAQTRLINVILFSFSPQRAKWEDPNHAQGCQAYQWPAPCNARLASGEAELLSKYHNLNQVYRASHFWPVNANKCFETV